MLHVVNFGLLSDCEPGHSKVLDAFCVTDCPVSFYAATQSTSTAASVITDVGVSSTPAPTPTMHSSTTAIKATKRMTSRVDTITPDTTSGDATQTKRMTTGTQAGSADASSGSTTLEVATVVPVNERT